MTNAARLKKNMTTEDCVRVFCAHHNAYPECDSCPVASEAGATNCAQLLGYWMEKEEDVDSVQDKTTNADKIRSMSDEELATFFTELAASCQSCPANDICDDHCSEETCRSTVLVWLKEEAKNESK